MRSSFKLSPFGIGGIFLCALLLLGGHRVDAQIRAQGGAQKVTFTVGGSRFLPAITYTGSNTICIGNTLTLSDATAGGVWTSSNPAVGSVGSSSGVVTAITGGTTLITYTLGTATATLMITVTYPISGAAGVCVGNYLILTDGTPTGLWSSSAPGVATVDPSGNVYGVAAGTATISYGRVGACSETKLVTVGNNTVAPITGPVTGALAVCQSGTLVCSDVTVGGTWSSSNTAIAAFVDRKSVV